MDLLFKLIIDRKILSGSFISSSHPTCSIVDNEIINLETPLINVEIECKIVDNSQQGILRLTNAEQINFFTDEKSIDYLNPRYKFVFANIRKIT